jgi:N-acetyl-gamma-glutamyl-phosphate reductase
MAQELSELAADEGQVGVTFVPHLAPMTRGLLATCYASIREGVLPPDRVGQREETRATLVARYESFYEHPFVAVASTPPSTKQTVGSNACLVYPNVDAVTGQVMVVSCLDNLVKGAAGGAVQCLNLMFGLDETTGLSRIGLYP